LPAEVTGFLNRHIDSVARLEILIAVMSAGGGCTAASVARALQVDETHVVSQLDALIGAGLVERDADGYRYAPRTSALRKTAAKLQELYATHRVAITTAIYSTPSDPVRGFSDAFRLRRDR